MQNDSLELNVVTGDMRREPGPVALRAEDLIAYRVTEWPPMRLAPAARTREWMDNTRQRFANRCLPLLMANQSGWYVLNTHPVRITWTGGWDPSCVRIQSLDTPGQQLPVSGHFGEGVVTFNLPYLFRTPPGVNLHVRGPANLPKDGVQALEGIVETDWSFATFTMNWKITRPKWPVTFEKDEPICMVVPQKRGYIESFDPHVKDYREDPQTMRLYDEWSKSRTSFITTSRDPASAAAKEGWQKHYFQGIDIEGTPAPEHQSKLGLKEFTDKGPATYPPLPQVEAHPEAMATLVEVAMGRVTPVDGVQHISYFAHKYTHPYAAGPHGSIVGALMCRALFPWMGQEVSDEAIAGQWASQRHAPFDGLFLEAAAGTFALGCATASQDPNVRLGCRKLWDERLRFILPPPPAP